MLYNILRVLAFLLAKLLFRLQVEGREHIPARGPLIIASNHLSNLDPIVLGIALPRRVGFMAKRELFAGRLIAAFLRKLEAFPVKRGRADMAAMKEAVRRLRQGGALILFPQGRRSLVFDREGFLGGVGFLAKAGGARVLPARIFGTDRALPPRSFLLRPAKVRIKFSSPLAFRRTATKEEVMREVYRAIKAIA